MEGTYRSLMGPRVVMGAAIVGLLGAAGMFLLEQIYNERRRVVLAQDLARLDTQVASMREELQSLKALQQERMQKKQQRSLAKRPKRRTPTSPVNENAPPTVPAISYTSDTDVYTTDYNSALGTDYDSSEEFYDLSSDTDADESSEKKKPKENGVKKGAANGTQNGSKKPSNEHELITVSDTLLVRGSERDVEEAYQLLQRVQENTTESEAESCVLWRLGRCCQRMSNVCKARGDREGQRECVTRGIDFCEEAVAKAPESSEAHKWYAILVGLRSDFVGTKEKILDGGIFKKHVDEALRLNPSDPSLHHLIGRFKFELSELSWLERKVASTLFSDVPMATYDEALQDFLEADKLCTDQWKENKLLLAKCYIGKGLYATGVDWLEKLVVIPSKTSDDEVAEAEAQVLLNKYSSYRSL